MRPNRRLHSEHFSSSTPLRRVFPALESSFRPPTRPEALASCPSAQRSSRAPPHRLATLERTPKGSGPLGANEAGGWRVFTTRFSALANRRRGREALSSSRRPIRPAAGIPVASSDSRGDRTRSSTRVEGRRDRFRAWPRERAPRFPDPRCLVRQAPPRAPRSPLRETACRVGFGDAAMLT
jgi:hypothetical protein